LNRSVIISGPPAVGKTTLAKGLASEFGLRYLGGGDILKDMAKGEGFDVGGDDWWDTPDGMKFLNRRDENPEFDRAVDDKLSELCKGGGVVITSYTLPWLVGDAIKIWLDGSHENSAKRMKNRDNMTKEDAFEITRERYDKNKALYKKLYGFEFGKDESVFDGIIDTDDLDAEQVMDVAKSLVRRLS